MSQSSQVHIQSRDLDQSEQREFLGKLLIGQRQLIRKSSKSDRESLDHIGWLDYNIKIILCTIVHYEQLVTVTASAILNITEG